ncbi:hypothetical protein AB1I63_04760 [Streptococcus pneumoniae]
MTKNPLKESIDDRLSAERYQVSEKKKEKKPISIIQLLLVLSMGLGLISILIQLVSQALK